MNMKYHIKNFLFFITQIPFSLLLTFRLTMLCLLFSFYNINFIKLIIIAVVVDYIFINNGLGIVVNIIYMKKYINDLVKSKYKVLEDNKFIMELKAEIEKYQQYKIENINKSKEIVFLRSNKNNQNSLCAFSIFNWISFIVIQNSIFRESDNIN